MKRNTLPGYYEGFGNPVYASWTVNSRYVKGYDGTRLAIDIVRPADEKGCAAEGSFPVILLISRGGRFTGKEDATGSDIIAHCVPYGYVGVVAEMRGCGASYGTNDSFCSMENRWDVTCIINWIAKQPWCSGRVGTFGGSNRGLIQMAAAVAKPSPAEALKAITPVVANADFYYQDYPNGVSALPRRKKLSGSENPVKKLTREELLAVVKPVDEDTDGRMAYEAYETGQYGKNHSFMGWLILEDMCRDDKNPNLGGEQTNLTIPPVTDLDVFKKTDIQIHQFAGFIESGAFGQLMTAKEWGGSILVGPWDHRESRRGTKAFPEGEFDFKAEHLKWFDQILKGTDNGFDQKPPFMYYTQNGEENKRWRCSDSWPLETVRPMTLYLSGDTISGTCASVNDGILTQEKSESLTWAEYRVDTDIQVFDEGNGGTMDRMHLTWDGDMAPSVDCRSLTFTSAPLFRMYENEITGEIPVELWVSSSKPDGDFILYLEEVFPDGRSRYVTLGCQRASHRISAPRKAWNECGATYHPSMRADVEKCLKEGMEQPVCLQFHLEPVSYVFHPGSRIRITVTCANKACFQHNMYDPEDLPVIRLYQGGDKASFVRLPFVEHTENVYNGTISMGEKTGPGTMYFFEKHTYLYWDGIWRRFQSDSEEMKYTVKNGRACFRAGFTFEQEGYPQKDGILQNYAGGLPAMPFPDHRGKVVAQVPVTAGTELLFAPDVKTLRLHMYAPTDENKKAPCVIYIHGYGSTISMIKPQVTELTKHGYAVVSADLRNYPPNCYPDYVMDMKGAVRYVRAHAKELGIDPDRIGCYGQSLGGNAALFAAVTGSEKELEGTVGGNEGVSSRIQAAVAGFAWSDLLYMGSDLADEYAWGDEALRRAKYNNSDGPEAPLAHVIGFAGEGKGIGVLREYIEKGREGSDACLDEMVRRARAASPVNHIGPDCPPLALYGGLGMTRVDIPNRQSDRTFEACSRMGVNCFWFGNTMGRYGERPEIINAVIGFLNQNLKYPSLTGKTVAVLGSRTFVEDGKDRVLDYPPLRHGKDGSILAAAAYVKERWGGDVKEAVIIDDIVYANAADLSVLGLGIDYYETKNMAVLAKRELLQDWSYVDRQSK